MMPEKSQKRTYKNRVFDFLLVMHIIRHKKTGFLEEKPVLLFGVKRLPYELIDQTVGVFVPDRVAFVQA